MQLLANGKQQFIDKNGAPLANGKVYFYQPLTTTPTSTYKDAAGLILNTNPIILDSAGQAVIWGSGTYRQIVFDANSIQLWDQSVATADINGTLNLIASSGSAQIGFCHKGTGAVTRTVQDKLREQPVSVKDFGAKGNGIADDTLSIQAACDFVQFIGGGTVFLPEGTYLVSAAINVGSGPSVNIVGSGRQSCTITTNSATANVLVMTAWYSQVESISFTSVVPRTGGIYVDLVGVQTTLQDFRMNGDFIGANMTGVACRIQNGVFESGAGGSRRIIAGGGDTSQIIDNVLMGAQVAPFPHSGIFVQDSSALEITNTSIINQGIDLEIAPSSGQGVYSLFAQNCFFDTADTGVAIVPQGTGVVVRCRFANCWTSSMTNNGFLINNPGGAATISGIHIVDLHAINNADAGISLNTTGISDVSIIGGEIAGNGMHGIYVAPGVSDFTICGALVGTGAGIGGNTGWGIVISGTSDRFVISNNRLSGNSIGAITDTSTGTNKIISSNTPTVVNIGGNGNAGPTTLTGDVIGSGAGTFATTLAATGIKAGTYGTAASFPVVTFDEKGRAVNVTTNVVKAAFLSGLFSGFATTDATGTCVLNFPAAFSGPAAVFCTASANGGDFIMTTGTITPTQVQVYSSRSNGVAAASIGFYWIALGPT